MSSSTLKVGIIGLPNVGKSTLFNAILGRQMALVAPYPFATVEPNVGVVDVPDERLGELRDAMFPDGSSRLSVFGSQLSDVSLSVFSQSVPETGKQTTDRLKSENRKLKTDNGKTDNRPPIVPATVTFVDIAGLVKGASQGQGLGNQFLGHIRDVDLILHVLRDFEADGVPRHQDSKNPVHDAEIVEMELELKDLETKEKAEKSKSPTVYSLLRDKPVIYAVNVGEEKLSQLTSYQFSVVGSRSDVSRFSVNQSQTGKQKTDKPESENGKPKTDNRIFFCAKLEEQISQLSKNEQKEYLKIYGLEKSCLDRIISECFRALGLISFFTAGQKEVRAWPVKKGSPAPAAAGVIHSDFEKLFIRAEIIGWEKMCQAGSWQAAKEKGLVRTEGKDYLVKDGDVCNFLIGK